MEAIRDHDNLELQLIVGASALLYRFGMVIDVIKKDGFVPDATLYSIVEGETPVTMAKSTGLAIIELATLFENLRPDIVLTVADRFETLATAVASSYMNIPLAHTQGGEITGSIDESVRHAVTKLSHVHFAATKQAAANIIRMGEDPASVYDVGCPSIDVIADIELNLPDNFFEQHKGVGQSIDSQKPYIVILQHPVTTEYGDGFQQVTETLNAINLIQIQSIWLWPNVDAGSDDISKGLRMYREQNNPANLRFYRNFETRDYARLIANCSCLIGNSSSAIREGAFLGVPAVNIGTRQQAREHAGNVVFVDYNANEIARAIETQLKRERYPSSTLYGTGDSGIKIANILSDANIEIQKHLNY
jgi:UDP-hydrolysing UDP-N-acetyl-D-glucosamine 2-epimerase